MTATRRFGDRMKIVEYLTNDRTLFYRVVLDILLEEEARLGIHLSTAEIAQRVREVLAVEPELLAQLPSVDSLLTNLRSWGNVDRIHNTRRISTPQEFVDKDFLYQLTSAGARVHREMTAIDQDMADVGALQSSMLPEVLNSLAVLVRLLESGDPDPEPVLGAFQATTTGFSRLAENAKLFIQGLNGSLASEQIRDPEAFIAYKNVVVRYLRSFTLVLDRTAPQISRLIHRAEKAGLQARLGDLASLETAPVLGVSQDLVVGRQAERMGEQWEGLCRWFVPTADRRPMAQLLMDRAADAINFIILTVGHINDQRFRRANRTADLVALAGWFDRLDPAGEEGEATALWRTAFGSYPARHLGHPRAVEDDTDTLDEVSWWDSDPAPVAAELRARGPQAESGPIPRVKDPRRVKSLLAARQQREQTTVSEAERSLAERGPIRLSALGQLEPVEADVFLSCLGLVMSAPTRRAGIRRARTPDGRLLVTLAPAVTEKSSASVGLRGGWMSTKDFELTISLMGRARG
ncbi:TIGR02677 family protein [Kitasatospora sp. NPDC059795]|uniref:TIGR02677 family protein n=1 Tax=Kitasatospora sp. NPDC059795 TaxID=3346949 RepID=UPI0036607687